ncbi:sensor histidine kinase [Nonomuraea purpurea]|uniref:histidine kinase n=1 Tax=Nonomuraea purpurea TaxID=1849276 RepID=A0ABV8G1Y6_9ACTN
MSFAIMRGWVGHPRMGDVAVALLVLLAELSHRTPHVEVVLIALAASGLMLLRREHPVAVALLVGLLYLAGTQAPLYDAPVSAMLIALYAVGRHTSAPVSAAVAAAAMAGGVYLAWPIWGPEFWVPLTVALFPAAPVAAGHIVRLRGELVRRTRQQVAERAIREERRRIARELHDVIAHHVSVAGLYMGVARRTIPIDPERAQQTLLTGESMARQAMTEMRVLLNVLRTDGEPIDNHAGVGVARLPALVEESGNAELEVTGEAVDLPATVDHAIYRVVQEALTNTRKHAAGARSIVRLAYEAGVVEVEVADEGRARPGGAGLGLGLAGMAERVSLCGGELRAGPAPSGGFVVRARIPLMERT